MTLFYVGTGHYDAEHSVGSRVLEHVICHSGMPSGFHENQFDLQSGCICHVRKRTDLINSIRESRI